MPDNLHSRPPRILAIANQKGGVGKTTTAINLGAALAKEGRSVLIVDLDPQGNASTGLGVEVEERAYTSYDLLLGTAPVQEIVRPTATERLLISPATDALSSADIDLGEREQRSSLLRQALDQPEVAALGVDYILVDCPPSLSLLTVNAMVAAHALLVPLQSEFYALEGLSQLMLTVREVRASANPDLRIEGIVLTMFDRRNNLSRQVETDTREYLGEMVCKTVIPRNVRLSEAPSYAVPVLDYAASSRGALAYRALAQELMSRHGPVTA